MMTLKDARHIFEIRLALEPVAFSLAAMRMSDNELSVVRALADQSRLQVLDENLEGFFETHFTLRRAVWAYAGNRHIEHVLQPVVVPLYAFYLYRRRYNPDGILAVVEECIAHQDRIIAALMTRDSAFLRKDTRIFLEGVNGGLEKVLGPDTRGFLS